MSSARLTFGRPKALVLCFSVRALTELPVPPSGYHEVVCTSATVAALQRRLGDPSTRDRPQIRISSTFFHHLSSDEALSPSSFEERTRSSEVVKKEVERLQVNGESWYPTRYEEGLKVGELVQVRSTLPSLAFLLFAESLLTALSYCAA